MSRTVAIGIQDFGSMMENDCFYIDKTCFIKEWWDNKDIVTLIARPRRFGKTLTMSMVEHFFAVKYKNRQDLFENLNIWKEEKYRNMQGTYPVIFLSFAAVKADNYQEAYADICELIAHEYRRNDFLSKADGFRQTDREQFSRIMSRKADLSDISASLKRLSEYLYRFYGKKVIILLDEYDTPMQEAYMSGYWSEISGFMRKLFNASFKTNPYLERAIMTGITRVSKESVFSDLNNLEVVTTTSDKYEISFGFTEDEVFHALEEFGLQEKKDDVKRWYDGFRFGNCDSIYNPWSITQFLDKGKFADYWANTSSNKLAGSLIQKGSPNIKVITEDLLQGKTFFSTIDEQIVFNQLEDDEAVWSFLLAGGYLKIAGYREKGTEFGMADIEYELALTNLEVRMVFKKMVHGWFANRRYGYHVFIDALMQNDLGVMNTYMNKVALYTFSSFDSGTKPSETAEPERFYHGFVLGLIVELYGKYTIRSNRESGFGRYDVLLEPLDRGNDGIIFEFKVIDTKKENSLRSAADAALGQIIDKKYAAEFEAKCISRDRIRIYGFAFRGKEVLIHGGYLKEFDRADQNMDE